MLRNKFGISDADELDAVEHAMAQARQVEIERGRVDIEQTLDAQHLPDLHRWLFQDIYSFASEYRTVSMAKLSRFAGVEEIEPCVNRAAAIVEEVDVGVGRRRRVL